MLPVGRARRWRRRPSRCSRAPGSTTSTPTRWCRVVAALAGYFAERGRLPDPPGPADAARRSSGRRAKSTIAWLRRLWDRGADAQSVQCRPMPNSQSPFSSGDDRVAGDRVVTAVLIGVAQEQREALAGFDRAPERVGVAPIGVALADRALPVPDVAGRHVQAPLLRDEVCRDRAVRRTSASDTSMSGRPRPATTSARRSRRRRCGAARRSRGCRSRSSTAAYPPRSSTISSWNVIRSVGSHSCAGMSSGRRLRSSARSAMRAEWFAERVAENVATASTNVPPAVASEAIVAASAIVGCGSGGTKRVQLARVVAQDLALGRRRRRP